MMTTLIVICSIMVIPVLANGQSSPDIELVLSNDVYHYGDKLEYTIIVSEITGWDASINITDPTGKTSHLVDMPISEEETLVIAPFGFDKIVWNEGKYSLELIYSEATFETEFTITDDGSIGIPYWINDLSKLWLTGQIPDTEFVKGIQYLLEHEILEKPDTTTELFIPGWFKFTTAWWSTGEISDTTYGHAIQFLIDEKFMMIPFDQESSTSIERSL